MMLQPSSMDVLANLKFGAIVCFYAMMAEFVEVWSQEWTEICGETVSARHVLDWLEFPLISTSFDWVCPFVWLCPIM